MNQLLKMCGFLVAIAVLHACATAPQGNYVGEEDSKPIDTDISEYVIGPGDSLEIFVWQHPDVSTTVPVRPDGRISMPLVEDMLAEGKTPTTLSRDLEKNWAATSKNQWSMS